MESKELKRAEVLAAEVEEGNNEYKFKLTNLSDEQFTHRITQLNWRLNEGCDEAVYEIGVEDDGNPLGLSSEDLEESLMNLKRMAESVGCDMTVQQFREGEVGTTAKVLLKRTERLLVAPVQVQVAVAGPADTGKSTLIAVLSSANNLDNGKGLARTQIFRHNHEVKSGRTSSNTQHNLYFGAIGNVLNSDIEGNGTGSGKGCSNRLRSRSDMELADETCRTISFIDLAGSSKYLKTTLHGIVGHSPDYFILVISARKGMEQMTSEFLGLCFALQLNLLVVITKIDTVSASTTAGVVGGLVKMLCRKGTETTGSREAVHIKSPDQLVNLILDSTEKQEKFGHQSSLNTTVVPIFLVSSVTGEGLDLLRSYLFQLPHHTRSWDEARAQLTQVRIIGEFKITFHEICLIDHLAECAINGHLEEPNMKTINGLGSFEKRDEKTTSTDIIGVKAGTMSSAVTDAPSADRENTVCCDFSSPVSRLPSPSSEKDQSGVSSSSLTSSEELIDGIGKFKSCDITQNCEITGDDATSIASLWMNSSKSPSPPPIASHCPLVGSQRNQTAPSSSAKLDSENSSGEVSEGFSLRYDGTARNGDCVGITDDADSSEIDKPANGSDSSTSSEEDKARRPLSHVASSLMGPDTVLFGQILSGVLTQGDCLTLGPIGTEGTFSLCSILSVRVNDVPVRSAVAGQTATMVLKQVEEELTSCSSVVISAASVSIDTETGRLANSSSVSLDSIYSGITSTTISAGDSSRMRENGGRVKTSFSQGGPPVSAGSGLVLLSPALNPIAYWEFEVMGSSYPFSNAPLNPYSQTRKHTSNSW